MLPDTVWPSSETGLDRFEEVLTSRSYAAALAAGDSPVARRDALTSIAKPRESLRRADRVPRPIVVEKCTSPLLSQNLLRTPRRASLHPRKGLNLNLSSPHTPRRNTWRRCGLAMMPAPNHAQCRFSSNTFLGRSIATTHHVLYPKFWDKTEYVRVPIFVSRTPFGCL